MRHGIPLIAIKHFLHQQRQHLTAAVDLSAVAESELSTGKNAIAKSLQGKTLTELQESEKEGLARIANELCGARRSVIIIDDD